jgi:molybdate transport system substrate-binding protein
MRVSSFLAKLSVAALVLVAGATASIAVELRILTTGAPRHVIDAVAEQFMKTTGHKVIIAQDTAGGVRRKIEAGEAAEIVVATPEVLDALATAQKVVPGSRVDFARTGVGVGIKQGLPVPDISTVDAIKRLLTSAPSIALPDPKAGGTSAVYLASMIEKLGLTQGVAAKVKLQAGGYAADLVASGDAAIVLHQMSEIKPVKGVVLVGPLPAEIQLTTTYSASLGAAAQANEPARAFMALLGGASGRAAAEAAGMDPVR